jgi:hypothetical protein
MFKLSCLLSFILLVISACQPSSSASNAPTAIPFPTMTPGRTVRGLLPTVVALPLNGSNLANPATAVALANRPTATPNTAACPPIGSPSLAAPPATGREMSAEIARFLSDGGAPATLETLLRSDWGVLGDAGFVRADLDLTGEGTPDVVVSFNAPDDGGTLLILGCADGRYRMHYQGVMGGSAPQIIQAGDMNQDTHPDLLFASQNCTDDECSYRTQLITWNPQESRFTGFIDGVIDSPEMPAVLDIDNDRVTEIVVRQTSRGTAETGPLRTGVTIYDWDGLSYTLSITQLDPAYFRIQVVQEADRNLMRLDVDQAIPIYEIAFNDTSLHNWYNDDSTVLNSYTLYRLMTAYAFTEDQKLLPTYQALMQNYPDPAAAPVYVTMGVTFWNALQVTNNLRSACLEVQDIIAARPEALGLLNRYGDSSPTYTANDLCPF